MKTDFMTIGYIFYKRTNDRGTRLSKYINEFEKHYECAFITGGSYMIEKDTVLWVGKSVEQFEEENAEYLV